MNNIFEMAKEAGFDEHHAKFDTRLEHFAKMVAKAKAEELATALEKGPVNDTAASIAIWIRQQ